MTNQPTPLHDALSDLASTMHANPDRLRQVRGRIARRRRNRVAAGTAVSVGAAAVSLAVVAVPRNSAGPAPRTAVADAPATTAALPACAAVAAPATEPAVKQPAVGVESRDPAAATHYKGVAVVTAVQSGSITLDHFEVGPSAIDGAATLTVDSATVVMNGDQIATAADIVVGQQVIISATRGAGSQPDHLDYLDVSQTVPSAPQAPVVKADAAPITKAGSVPEVSIAGKAVIETPAAGNVLTVQTSVDGIKTEAIRLVLINVTYFRNETRCVAPELVPGTAFMFIATANTDGSYAVSEIHLAN